MSVIKKVGFIGVGLMGHGMAKNLLEKGHHLTILGHRNRQPVEDLVARGAVEAATPAELAHSSDIIFLCVSNSVQVEAVIEGENGILSAARKGLVVVDTSTADPDSTLRLAMLLQAKGVRMADAPLTRTPVQAEEGRLNVMVGADLELFAELEPVIACFAENILHVGPLGAGHKIKLINNFIALGNASLVAEAVTAAVKVGVDLGKLFELVSSGGANSKIFQMVMPWVLQGDISNMQFAIANAAKDLRYYSRMVQDAKLSAPVSPAVLGAFSLAEALGEGGEFVPRLCDVIAGINKVDVHKG
jgi:3-hydroxyisobutyrate dehydrogenase-like beta-hydroxyacid dehydrogenase